MFVNELRGLVKAASCEFHCTFILWKGVQRIASCVDPPE